jgi:hypothetical protein
VAAIFVSTGGRGIDALDADLYAAQVGSTLGRGNLSRSPSLSGGTGSLECVYVNPTDSRIEGKCKDACEQAMSTGRVDVLEKTSWVVEVVAH